MKVAVLGGTGAFGSALAARLVEAGMDVTIGSRDPDRAAATAAEIGAAGAVNEDAVGGVDLAVLSVDASAALSTAAELADAIGETPVLSVASQIRFENKLARPADDPVSLAERVQQLLRGPVLAGLHSLAASSLSAGKADGDALVCGDDEQRQGGRARARGDTRHRPRTRRGPARERTGAGGHDRRDRQPQSPLPRSRRAPDPRAVTDLTISAVRGLPELREGDDLAGLIVERAELRNGDVLVVAQKAISKIEGRIVRLDEVEPSARARELAGDGDARRIEVILREAKRIVRTRGSLLIAETRHGFVCASSGVDASNTPEPGTLVLLPVDPDASAARLRERLRELTGHEVGIVVSDSFGRPWRQGTTDVAIGAAGVEVLRDLKGERDPTGYELRSTVIAIADEIAGAAELVMGKLDRAPVAIVRGLEAAGEGSARDLVMPAERNLFP